MGDAPVMGAAPAPPGPPPKVMGPVPSPPSALGQVVGSEGSAESDGEEEDCNGEKVVVEVKERPAWIHARGRVISGNLTILPHQRPIIPLFDLNCLSQHFSTASPCKPCASRSYAISNRYITISARAVLTEPHLIFREKAVTF